MIKGIEGVLLSSANAKKLADFYKQKLGLKVGMEAEMGDADDMVFEMKLGKGSSSFYIADHSKIKGPAKDPQRILLNFEVDNLERMVKQLKKLKVKLVADIYHLQEYGYVATFADPDGNYFQLVKTRPD